MLNDFEQNGDMPITKYDYYDDTYSDAVGRGIGLHGPSGQDNDARVHAQPQVRGSQARVGEHVYDLFDWALDTKGIENFDALISFSAIDHADLGRCGDRNEWSEKSALHVKAERILFARLVLVSLGRQLNRVQS